MDALDHLINTRREMKLSDGIYIRKEMHATDWLLGKGRVAPHRVPVPDRVRLYNYFLSSICLIPGVRLINAACAAHRETLAFERLLNRINVNMQRAGSSAIIFSDEGKNYDSMLRRLRRFNPISSRFGAWGDGQMYANRPLNRILEDIVYRDSRHSLLVQAADSCAYALLRREHPIPSKTALGLDRSFYILRPIMVTQAFRGDPLGVIRCD